MSTQSIRLIKFASVVAVFAAIVGCAHPINVSAERTPERVESNLTSKKVAYVMTDANRTLQVTTSGGGGDKVSHFPYRDLEKGIRDALRSVYTDVISNPTVGNVAALKSDGIQLVFTPEIVATSSSPSAFTWPPTQFTFNIICTVTDAAGAEVSKFRVEGNGAAEFEEFKSNFNLSAARAGTDVTNKLARQIREDPKLK